MSCYLSMLEQLSILSWNVRGLGSDEKCRVVKSLRESSCNIVCLQETKWTENSIFRLRKVCCAQFVNASFTDAQGSSGGTLISWKSLLHAPFSLSLTYSNTIIIQISLTISIMITNVYCPIEIAQKYLLFQELKNIQDMNNLPWIIIGDFNVLRAQTETTGGPMPSNPIRHFNELIHDLNLILEIGTKPHI